MEIYKDLNNPDNQQFEKLLNSQLSKINIEEGKIIEGKINKITDSVKIDKQENFITVKTDDVKLILCDEKYFKER